MRIRLAEQKDLSAIQRILNQAITKGVAVFDLEEKSTSDIEEWFQQYKEYYPLIIAEHEGELAGYASVSAFNKKKAYLKTGELSVYIDPNYQGLGIGKVLMKEILLKAQEQGFHTIISLITKGNERSVVLHERFGFRFVGVLEEVGFKFGQWHDVEFYQWFPTKNKEV